MGKVDWGNLEIIEEWTPVQPGDPDALAEEKRKLDLLASLMLKVHRRERLERALQKDRENERIRKKVGLIA